MFGAHDVSPIHPPSLLVTSCSMTNTSGQWTKLQLSDKDGEPPQHRVGIGYWAKHILHQTTFQLSFGGVGESVCVWWSGGVCVCVVEWGSLCVCGGVGSLCVCGGVGESVCV